MQKLHAQLRLEIAIIKIVYPKVALEKKIKKKAVSQQSLRNCGVNKTQVYLYVSAPSCIIFRKYQQYPS